MPASSPAPDAAADAVPARTWLVVVFLGFALFGLRLLSPADLTDNDQERPASYILDAVQNGHWAIQRDAYDDIASKPPMLTWLSGLATLAWGRLDRFSLYLPCALAVIGIALLIQGRGRASFGGLAGFLGALTFLFCQYGFKHVVLARNDALFAFTVALAALAGFRAWNRGRGWTWFWLAAAAATLTKGPLGLLLAAGGFLAVPWERRRGEPWPVRGHPWAGAVLWLLVVGGWFALAWQAAGDDFIRKQLGRELAGHLTGSESGGKWPGSDPFHCVLYFLSRYAPWSLAAAAGFWRVWRHPATDPAARRCERFLTAWFFAGLVVFTIAPHKRPDLLLPIIPPAAILAGRELAGWLGRFRPAIVWRTATAAGVLLLGGLALARPQGRTTVTEVVATRAMEEIARAASEPDLQGIPLTFVDHTLSVQFYLNRHQLVTSPRQAAALFLEEAAALVVTRDPAALRRQLPAEIRVRTLAVAPSNGPPVVHLLARRPAPGQPAGPAVLALGPLQVWLDGAELVSARRTDLLLRRTRPDARVRLRNDSSLPVEAGLRWVESPGAPPETQPLAPGETWSPSPP